MARLGGEGERGITVVGCGVVGLTAAVRLAEAGFAVRIVARELPPDTTSNRAAAVWTPYRAFPEEEVAEWSAASYAVYRALYREPEAGVSPVALRVVAKEPLSDPAWRRPEIPFRRLAPAERPAGYADGYEAEVPLVHSGRFLAYLMDRVARAGATVERRALGSLADLGPECRVIVNCSGLGARELAGDASVFPIRGQLAVVADPGGVGHFVDDTTYPDPVYLFPRAGEVILGGTAEEGADDLAEDPATRERIRRRCEALVPGLAASPFLRAVVGLRPGRPAVRLEREDLPDGRVVIHDYGHGGAGFTVAWGCAEEVLRLVAGAPGGAPHSASGPVDGVSQAQ